MGSNPSLLAVLLLLTSVVLVLAISRKASGATEDPANAFQDLIEASVTELEQKNAAHTANWGLGNVGRWDLDQETGDLVFSSEDGTRIVAPAQIIGSFSAQSNTWLWAWDNPSVVDAMKVDALKLKEYGEEHGIERLTTNKWPAAEADAWEMVALAVKLLGAQGAYRGPAGSTYIFMTFGKVEIIPPEP